MRLGAMNNPIQSLPGQIDEIAGLGFDLLELAMDPPQAHHSQVWKMRNSFSRRLQQAGLGLICHLPTFVYPADLTASIRQASITELLEAARVAAGLGAEKVVLHPPLVNGLGSHVPELSSRYVAEALHRVIRHATGLGLSVCLENMFPAYGGFWHPDHFDSWLEEYPQLRLTLDAGHANIGSKSVKALAFVRRYGRRIGHLHLSDNDGRRDQHQALGTAGVDFRSLAAAATSLSADITATLEVFSPDRAQLAASRKAWLAMLKAAGS